MAKHRPTWKDSDAPDAEGKFKNLSCGALAKWMIKSRKGDMRKIVGSLNQQYVLAEQRAIFSPHLFYPRPILLNIYLH